MDTATASMYSSQRRAMHTRSNRDYLFEVETEGSDSLSPFHPLSPRVALSTGGSNSRAL